MHVNMKSPVMPKIYITDLKPGREVSSVFVLSEKSLRQAKNGNPFLTLKLVDKTGQVAARVWDRAEEIDALLRTNTPVQVQGRCELFRDELQVQVQDIRPLPVTDVDPSDFLPVCPVDADVLQDRLKNALGRIKRDSFKRLVRSIFADKALMGRFRKAPAAKGIHHAYLGGLLEHTTSLVLLAGEVSKHYPSLDADMLLMGAFLHDIGKIDEFVYDLSIDYSDVGRLLGHMILGARIVEQKIAGLKSFPEEDAVLLTHMILSHHGEAEFGAVKVPMTREALVLHILDDLDARVDSLDRILGEPGTDATPWTGYQTIYGRSFYRGTGAQAKEDEESPAPEDAPAEKGRQLGLWTRPTGHDRS